MHIIFPMPPSVASGSFAAAPEIYVLKIRGIFYRTRTHFQSVVCQKAGTVSGTGKKNAKRFTGPPVLADRGVEV